MDCDRPEQLMSVNIIELEKQTLGFEKGRWSESGAPAAAEAELAETAVDAFSDRHRSAYASPHPTFSSISSLSLEPLFRCIV